MVAASCSFGVVSSFDVEQRKTFSVHHEGEATPLDVEPSSWPVMEGDGYSCLRSRIRLRYPLGPKEDNARPPRESPQVRETLVTGQIEALPCDIDPRPRKQLGDPSIERQRLGRLRGIATRVLRPPPIALKGWFHVCVGPRRSAQRLWQWIWHIEKGVQSTSLPKSLWRRTAR